MKTKQSINEDSFLALNDNALIALLLSSEKVNRFTLEKSEAILSAYDYNLEKLYRASVNDLANVANLEQQDVFRLKAALVLSERRKINQLTDQLTIHNSRDVYQLFTHLADYPFEEFWILVLDKANHVIGRIKVSEGGVASTVVDPKRLFHHVLALLGTSVILIHNHPSGNLNPSDADIKLTNRIVQAGDLLEIMVLDHLIITSNGYLSFMDKDLIERK